MKKSRILFLTLVVACQVHCGLHFRRRGPAKPANYDLVAHRSVYPDPPFTDLVIPGKWWKIQNASGAESRAPIFYNEDSTVIWLDRYPREQFSAGQETQSETQYLDHFWMAVQNNWARRGLRDTVLLTNTARHFILCQTLPEDPCCTMHLIGFQKNIAYHFSLTGTTEMEEKANLLESLYLLN